MRRQAILPESYDEPTLDTMSTGERVYTTPWGMWVDRERKCWLHPKYIAEKSLMGTVCMRVEKRRDGYHVWPPRDEKWTPGPPGYASPVDTEWIPVVKLHTGLFS